MSVKILNRENAMLHGLSKNNENLWGVAGYKKIVVIEVDDMHATTGGIATNGVVYTFPCACLLQNVIVHNYGTTAVAIATGAAIDESTGSADQTGDFKTLAANTTMAPSVATHTAQTAGAQLLWDFDGTNSSLATCKLRIVIEYLAAEDVSV